MISSLWCYTFIFLDYIAVGKLKPVKWQISYLGVAEACEKNRAAPYWAVKLRMASFCDDEDYDVAGFAVGIVDRPKLITGESIRDGEISLSRFFSSGFIQ